MSESYIQLPIEGAGKKVRATQKTVVAQTVFSEHVIADSVLNFIGAYTICLRIAGSTSALYQFLSLFNPAASGRILRIKAIRLTVDIGSVANQIKITRTNTLGTGTSQTPTKKDTSYAASIANVRSALTVNAGVVNDFIGVAKGTTATLKLLENLAYYDAKLQRDQIVLREGEGIVIRQLSAGAATEFLNTTIEWSEYTTS